MKQHRYAVLLKQGIDRKGISLAQVCFRLAKIDICLDKGVLSKMQNGKHPPAKDSVNLAIAGILGIDSDQFRIAAAREILPESLMAIIEKSEQKEKREEGQLV